MQYNFQNKNGQFEISIYDTLVDVVYEIDKLKQYENIGLLKSEQSLKTLEQDKHTKQVFNEIFEWTKKNVAEYEYIEQIKEQINLVLNYGTSTTIQSNEQLQIISAIHYSDHDYKLFITKDDNCLSLQTNTNTESDKISTSLNINLSPFDEKGQVIHSIIESSTVKAKLYEYKGITLKETKSNNKKMFYRSLSEIDHSIDVTMDLTQIKDDPHNPNNNDIVLQERRKILVKNMCQDPSVIACIYKETNYSKNNEQIDGNTNNIYYLSRNNSNNSLKLTTNRTKCPITLEQYEQAIKTGIITTKDDTNINISEFVDKYETENFIHIANLSDYRKIYFKN